MPKRNQEGASWLRYSGIGFNFVAAIAAFALLGYGIIDRYFGKWPWGLVTGAVLGMIAGMYNLIRESMAAFKEQAAEDAERKASRDRDH